MVDSLTLHAHAKANLFLRVLSRETSGFHGLETLFTLLEMHDTLTVERIPSGIELSVDGADTGATEDNLAYRAAAMVLEATGHSFGVRMHLDKRIPIQAGLGGGSADAAAALVATNTLAGRSVPQPEILQFAAKLGSDVPFLASGAPMALAWGRGERLFRIPAPPAKPALVAVPPVGVPTARAYALLDSWQARPESRGPVVLDPEAFATWGGIGQLGGNDFENPVFGTEPAIRDLFERVAQTRPLLVRLSGSGAAIIAVFKTQGELESAASALGERDQQVVLTATRASPAPGPEAVE
jgi:4-diphosphocytidyl-2-C-methyl-D-erythritol kinase